MFRPLQDFILIRPVKRLQSRILEVVSNEKYSRGLVVAVGPGERIVKRYSEGGNRWRSEETGARRAMVPQPGDFVTLENSGRYPEIEIDGVRFRVHQDKDVAFISERAYIDQHNELSDAEIDALLAAHRPPAMLTIEELEATKRSIVRNWYGAAA